MDPTPDGFAEQAGRDGDEEWIRDLLRRSGPTIRTSIVQDLLVSDPWTGPQLIRLRHLRRGAFLAARRRTEWRRRARLRVLSGTDDRLHPITSNERWLMNHRPRLP